MCRFNSTIGTRKLYPQSRRRDEEVTALVTQAADLSADRIMECLSTIWGFPPETTNSGREAATDNLGTSPRLGQRWTPLGWRNRLSKPWYTVQQNQVGLLLQIQALPSPTTCQPPQARWVSIRTTDSELKYCPTNMSILKPSYTWFQQWPIYQSCAPTKFASNSTTGPSQFL